MSEHDNALGKRSSEPHRDNDRSVSEPPERGKPTGSRDDTLDADLERERLEPGMNSGGEGESGADPNKSKPVGNSNT